MADTYDAWPPATFADSMQAASEQAIEQQAAFLRRLFAPPTDAGIEQLDAMSTSTATFKTRVQSGGRISIPDAEREALDIGDGDIVQVVVLPLRGGDDE
jgi:hypothetical protein